MKEKRYFFGFFIRPFAPPGLTPRPHHTGPVHITEHQPIYISAHIHLLISATAVWPLHVHQLRNYAYLAPAHQLAVHNHTPATPHLDIHLSTGSIYSCLATHSYTNFITSHPQLHHTGLSHITTYQPIHIPAHNHLPTHTQPSDKPTQKKDYPDMPDSLFLFLSLLYHLRCGNFFHCNEQFHYRKNLLFRL